MRPSPIRSTSARSWSSSAQIWPQAAQIWSESDQTQLRKNPPTLAESIPNLLQHIAQQWSTSAHTWSTGPTLVETNSLPPPQGGGGGGGGKGTTHLRLHYLHTFLPARRPSHPHSCLPARRCSMCVPRKLSLRPPGGTTPAHIGPSLAESSGAKFDRVLAKIGRSWSSSAKFGRPRSKSGRCCADFGRFRSKSGHTFGRSRLVHPGGSGAKMSRPRADSCPSRPSRRSTSGAKTVVDSAPHFPLWPE